MSNNSTKNDKKTKNWLKDNELSKKIGWDKCLIQGITSSPNPFHISLLQKYENMDEYKNNNIIRMYSKDCEVLSFNINQEEKQERSRHKLDKKIYFKNTTMSPLEMSNANKEVACTPANDFFIGETQMIDLHTFKKPLPLKLKEIQVLRASLIDFEIKVGFIEPILCTAFLFSDKAIISEQWNFIPTQTMMYLEQNLPNEKFISNQNVAFHYSSISKMSYLVVIIKRIIQNENGKACEQYYLKNNNANAKKAMESVNESLNDYFDLLNPFAITFVPISELMAEPDGFAMPNPVKILEQPTLDELDEMVQNINFFKKKCLPFKITIKADFKSIADSNCLIQDGFKFLNSMGPLKMEPSFRFENSFRFTIFNSCLKSKTDIQYKNIYAVFTIRNGIDGEKLKIIHNPYNDELDYILKSPCSFNPKEPVFNQVILFELPPIIEKNICFVIEFYSNLTGKTLCTPLLIGKSFLNLFKDGKIRQNGNYNLSLSYGHVLIEMADDDLSNSTTVSLNITSSLFFLDDKLNKFFEDAQNNQFDMDNFVFISDYLKHQHFLEIINSLIYLLPYHGIQIVKAFEDLSKNVHPFYDNFQETIVSFATYFPLNISENNQKFHIVLIKSWTELLNEHLSDEKVTERFDVPLADFFFILIIKSILIYGDEIVSQDFIDFFKILSKSTNTLIQFGLLQAQAFCISFTHFLNMLYEIGCYSLVVDAIDLQLNSFGNEPNDHKVMTIFLENILLPKLLFSSLFNIPKMYDIISNLIRKAKDSLNSLPLQRIFLILLKNCSFIESNSKMRSKVASKLIPLLSILNPLSSLPFTSTNEIHASFVVFDFIIFNVSLKKFKKWWETADQKQMFISLHFLLEKIRIKSIEEGGDQIEKLATIESIYLNSTRGRSGTALNSRAYIAKHRSMMKYGMKNGQNEFENSLRKESIVYDTHHCVYQIIKHLTSIISNEEVDKKVFFNPASNNLTIFSETTKVLYHLLSVNLPINLICPLVKIFIELINTRIDIVFTQFCPVLPKFLLKIISLSPLEPKITELFDVLFEADRKHFGNNNRSNIICTYFLSLCNTKYISFIHCKELNEQISQIQYLQHSIQSEVKIEQKAYSLYQKSLCFINSPDARITCLDELAEFQKQNEFFEEEIQVYLLQSAIIVEYLSLLKKIKNPIIPKGKHAASIFSDICTATKSAFCPDSLIDDVPEINCFCDSSYFSVSYLISLLEKVIIRCFETRLYEYGIFLIDYLWPLLERYKSFRNLRILFENTSEMIQSLSLVTDKDRLFGSYFRVSFWGYIFGDKDKQSYIYHVPKPIHLYAVSKQIIEEYQATYGEDKIQLINGNNMPELDKDIGYIQITYLIPTVSKNDCNKRRTLFENSQNIPKFIFETPFTKSGKKAQGTIEDQMLLRTILTVEYPMPSVIQWQKVSEVRTVTIEPIRVSYIQIKEKISQLNQAIQNQDSMGLQQLLHGSLLAQVNAGPIKMAEVFLNKDYPESKYKDKLRNAFTEFLSLLHKSLKIHALYVTENIDFIPLQHELESSFISFEHDINEYLDP